MTYKGAIDEVKSLSQNSLMPDIFKPSLNKIAETLEMEKETCDDTISRKEVVFVLNDAQVEYDENYKGLGKAKEIIDSLSPVQSIRPKGEWIFQEIINAYYVTGQCSRCTQRNRIDNFCPNCGADMREE